jgi:hypothetical protein
LLEPLTFASEGSEKRVKAPSADGNPTKGISTGRQGGVRQLIREGKSPSRRSAGSLVSAASSFLFELRQNIFNLLLRKGFAALGALKQFVGQLVINEIIREVDPVESYGKAVNSSEVPVLAAVTKKIVVRHLHRLPPCSFPVIV